MWLALHPPTCCVLPLAVSFQQRQPPPSFSRISHTAPPVPLPLVQLLPQSIAYIGANEEAGGGNRIRCVRQM